MTRIILVRHGETTWNIEGRYQGKQDTLLSEKGVAQGKQLAEALCALKIDAVYASPLRRAYDTAVMCAAYHGLPVIPEPRFQEIDHGEWEGLLAEEVAVRYGPLLERWKTTVVGVQMPGGETIEQVRERVMAAVEEIVARHMGKSVLIVAHDAVNKVMICSALGVDLSRFWQIKQDNTCINVIEYTAGIPRISLLNSTCHMGYLISGIEQKGL